MQFLIPIYTSNDKLKWIVAVKYAIVVLFDTLWKYISSQSWKNQMLWDVSNINQAQSTVQYLTHKRKQSTAISEMTFQTYCAK